MDDPHDDTDVPSGTTDGAQMERTLPPVRLDLPGTCRSLLGSSEDGGSVSAPEASAGVRLRAPSGAR